jgi:hypothetical protein
LLSSTRADKREPIQSFGLETRFHKDTDFFIFIEGVYYQPVQKEPFELRLGDLVFTRCLGLSFPTIVKIKEIDKSWIVGKSLRSNTEYTASLVEVICAFKYVKIYCVYEVTPHGHPKVVFSSCDFAACCSLQEEKQNAADVGHSLFYVSVIK